MFLLIRSKCFDEKSPLFNILLALLRVPQIKETILLSSSNNNIVCFWHQRFPIVASAISDCGITSIPLRFQRFLTATPSTSQCDTTSVSLRHNLCQAKTLSWHSETLVHIGISEESRKETLPQLIQLNKKNICSLALVSKEADIFYSEY